ncbi:hypothetical protein ACEWY4_017115 [Coilia grayii]|uniref:MADF domain-containing protein n=1 Tax=Coilia grayii TaxID=363190 RepID=A0ABD1JH40_9TELE
MAMEDRICELVRGYIHLYDATVPGHRDKQRCKNSWEEIATLVGLSAKEVQSRWNLARDRYVRAHRERMSKASGGRATGPEHPILQRLGWLKGHIKHRRTSTNFDVSIQGEVHEEELEEGEEEAGPPSPSSEGEGPSSPPPTTTAAASASAGGSAATLQRALAGKRKRGEDVDPVGAALLGRLDELRQEAIQKRSVYGTFTAYLQSFLEELPPADAKKLVKDIQHLMLSY